MRAAFVTLHRSEPPRPGLYVQVDGLEGNPLSCLVDTGSFENRFAGWVARVAGIDLSGIEETDLGIGGQLMKARTTIVGLSMGDLRWEAAVSFCDPWPWDHHLLGQNGFFRFFVVTIDAANGVVDLQPNKS